jgi:hypothetical protein
MNRQQTDRGSCLYAGWMSKQQYAHNKMTIPSLLSYLIAALLIQLGSAMRFVPEIVGVVKVSVQESPSAKGISLTSCLQ